MIILYFFRWFFTFFLNSEKMLIRIPMSLFICMKGLTMEHNNTITSVFTDVHWTIKIKMIHSYETLVGNPMQGRLQSITIHIFTTTQTSNFIQNTLFGLITVTEPLNFTNVHWYQIVKLFLENITPNYKHRRQSELRTGFLGVAKCIVKSADLCMCNKRINIYLWVTIIRI